MRKLMKTKKECNKFECNCIKCLNLFSEIAMKIRLGGRKKALKEVLKLFKDITAEDYQYVEFKIKEMMEK